MASPDTTVPEQPDMRVPVETVEIGAKVISGDGRVAEVVHREADDFDAHGLIVKMDGRINIYGPYPRGTLIRLATAEEVADQEAENLRAWVVRSINQLSHHVNNGVIPVSVDNPLTFRVYLNDFAQLCAIAEGLGVAVKTMHLSGVPSKYADVTWPPGGVTRGFYAQWTTRNPNHPDNEQPAE